MHNTTVFTNAFLPFLRASRATAVQLLLEHLSESELYPRCEKFVAAALVNAMKGEGKPADLAAVILSTCESQSFPAKGLKQSLWLAKTVVQCSTVPYTELTNALCAVRDNGDQQCEIMFFFHKDKRGVKLLSVAHVVLEERAIELARQGEVDVLRKRALSVIDDSTKMTNATDVDWCDFLNSASCLAEDRRAVRLIRFGRRWLEYMGSGCVRPLYERAYFGGAHIQGARYVTYLYVFI